MKKILIYRADCPNEHKNMAKTNTAKQGSVQKKKIIRILLMEKDVAITWKIMSLY